MAPRPGVHLRLAPNVRGRVDTNGEIYLTPAPDRRTFVDGSGRQLHQKVVCPTTAVDRSTGKHYRMRVEDNGRLVVTEADTGARRPVQVNIRQEPAAPVTESSRASARASAINGARVTAMTVKPDPVTVRWAEPKRKPMVRETAVIKNKAGEIVGLRRTEREA